MVRVAVDAPEKFELFQNFPNPFNPSTSFSYILPENGHVNLKVYNLLGEEVSTVADAECLPGYHEEVWDASRFASGMYVYQISSVDDRGKSTYARRRMLLLK